MEARELRIGNYYHWSAEGKNYPMQVDAKDFSNDNYKNFEPIPLTEDWLLKFGWVWNEECNSFEKYPNGDSRMHLAKSTFGYNMFNYVLKAVIKNDIRYVHQLQNLFYSLTGSELTNKANKRYSLIFLL